MLSKAKTKNKQKMQVNKIHLDERHRPLSMQQPSSRCQSVRIPLTMASLIKTFHTVLWQLAGDTWHRVDSGFSPGNHCTLSSRGVRPLCPHTIISPSLSVRKCPRPIVPPSHCYHLSLYSHAHPFPSHSVPVRLYPSPIVPPFHRRLGLGKGAQ